MKNNLEPTRVNLITNLEWSRMMVTCRSAETRLVFLSAMLILGFRIWLIDNCVHRAKVSPASWKCTPKISLSSNSTTRSRLLVSSNSRAIKRARRLMMMSTKLSHPLKPKQMSQILKTSLISLSQMKANFQNFTWLRQDHRRSSKTRRSWRTSASTLKNSKNNWRRNKKK